MFINLLQIFNIIFDIQDIRFETKSLCIPPSWIFISIVRAGRHNLVKVILCFERASGHFPHKSCSFTFLCSKLKKRLV